MNFIRGRKGSEHGTVLSGVDRTDVMALITEDEKVYGVMV
jgi:hypothetical protein